MDKLQRQIQTQINRLENEIPQLEIQKDTKYIPDINKLINKIRQKTASKNDKTRWMTLKKLKETLETDLQNKKNQLINLKRKLQQLSDIPLPSEKKLEQRLSNLQPDIGVSQEELDKLMETHGNPATRPPLKRSESRIPVQYYTHEEDSDEDEGPKRKNDVDTSRPQLGENLMLLSEKAKALKLETETLDAALSEEEARLAAEKEEARLKAEAERLEAEARLKAERLEAERLQAEARLKAERLEAERLEAERLEAEQLEAEQLQAERLEAERLEAEQLEADRLAEEARLDAQKAEAERVAAEKAEEERAEQERVAALRAEEARLEAERARAEAERLAAETTETERLEAARLAAEEARSEAERLEAERLEAEKARAEAERKTELRLAAARAASEKLRIREERKWRRQTVRKDKRTAKKQIKRDAKLARRTARREKEKAEEARRIALGKRFRTTLNQTKKNIKPITTNPNIICKAIHKTGKNMTKKYYLPSQFPNLTKLKPITSTESSKT
jgi:hypothetical protein